MKRSILFFAVLLVFQPSAKAQFLRNIFGGGRRQVQVQASCYQPVSYQPTYYQPYQAVAAIPLATVPVAVDLQAYQYSVNAAAFQSFRDYMASKSSSAPPETPNEVAAAPVPARPASDSADTRLAGAVVLKQQCLKCHQEGNNPKNKFAIFDKKGDIYANLPWNEIVSRITAEDPNERMPPKGSLSRSDLSAVVRLAVSGITGSPSSLPEKEEKVASNSDKLVPFD